jgi:hypothetical protein
VLKVEPEDADAGEIRKNSEQGNKGDKGEDTFAMDKEQMQ